MSRNARLFAILALLNTIWAPVNLMVTKALGAGFSPAGIGLVRWTFVAIVCAVATRIPAVAGRLKLRLPNRRDFVGSLLLGALLAGPAHLIYYLALRHTLTVEGTVFNTTAPLWVALFAGLFLRERIGPRRWTALAIGTAGAYVAAVGFAAPSLHAGHAGWNALYLLGTLMESVTAVSLAALVRRSSGLTVFGVEAIGMTAVFVVAPLLFPAALPVHIPAVGLGWAPLLYLIVFAGVIAFGTWFTLVERAPLSLMVLTLALQPVIAAVISYLALGERVTTSVAFGAGLVVVALAVAVFEPSRLRGDGSLVLDGALASSPLGHEVPAD